MTHDPHTYHLEKRVNELQRDNEVLIAALERIQKFGWDAYISAIANKALTQVKKNI